MRLLRSLRYADVVATIALFVALGGGAYAAVALPAKSVGGKQLKRNAVTASKIKKSAVRSSDVRNGSLRSRDFKRGELPVGAPGARGERGEPGLVGPRGDTGPSEALVANRLTSPCAGDGFPPPGCSAFQDTKTATLADVPAGRWLATARIRGGSTFAGGAGTLSCAIRETSEVPDESTRQLGDGDTYEMYLAGPVVLEAVSDVRVECRATRSASTFVPSADVRLTLQRVGALDVRAVDG